MAVFGEPKRGRMGGRRADRAPFDARVKFRCGNRRATVRVLDMSRTGARVSAIHLLREGETFFITLPGLSSIEARVAWANSFELGCEFMQPLHPAVFEELLRRKPQD